MTEQFGFFIHFLLHIIQKGGKIQKSKLMLLLLVGSWGLGGTESFGGSKVQQFQKVKRVWKVKVSEDMGISEGLQGLSGLVRPGGL